MTEQIQAIPQKCFYDKTVWFCTLYSTWKNQVGIQRDVTVSVTDLPRHQMTRWSGHVPCPWRRSCPRWPQGQIRPCGSLAPHEVSPHTDPGSYLQEKKLILTIRYTLLLRRKEQICEVVAIATPWHICILFSFWHPVIGGRFTIVTVVFFFFLSLL